MKIGPYGGTPKAPNVTLAVSLPLDVRQTALARRSSKVTPWGVAYARDVGPEDFLRLHSVTRDTPNGKAPLAKIRNPHHTLARFLAEGKTDIEVSGITGYSLSRVRTLRNDPAFQELITFYVEEQKLSSPDVKLQLEHLTLTAASILQERLEEEPESFTSKELTAILTSGADRIGHGPTSKIQTVTDPTEVLAALKEALVGESRIVPRAEITAEYTEVLSDSTPALEADDEPTPQSPTT